MTDNTGVTSWVDTQDDMEAIVVITILRRDTPLAAVGSFAAGGAGFDPTMIGKMSFGFNSKFFKGRQTRKVSRSSISYLAISSSTR